MRPETKPRVVLAIPLIGVPLVFSHSPRIKLVGELIVFGGGILASLVGDLVLLSSFADALRVLLLRHIGNYLPQEQAK